MQISLLPKTRLLSGDVMRRKLGVYTPPPLPFLHHVVSWYNKLYTRTQKNALDSSTGKNKTKTNHTFVLSFSLERSFMSQYIIISTMS